MSFTIVKSADDTPTNKLFIDGKQVDRKARAYWYVEVPKPFDTGSVLRDLYDTIQLIEKENLPWIIVNEKVKRKDGGRFRLSANEGWLEENCYRSWIQFDIDTEEPQANLLSLRARLEKALAGLPFLTPSNDAPSVGMVVQLSNKAGLQSYPDRLALRIYVELKEKDYTNALVKHALEPYEDITDTNMFNRASVHLVQPPEVHGDVQRVIDGPTCVYIPGEPLSLATLKDTPGYDQQKTRVDTFKTTLKGLGSFSPDGEQMQKWRELAAQGHFESKRDALHFKILAQAQWRNQNGRAVIEALVREPTGYGTIMGEQRGRKDLEEQLEAVERGHRTHFLEYLDNYSFHHYLPDPATPDLRNAELPELVELVKRNIANEVPTSIAIRSPHGSSKTTAILPLVKDAMKEVLGRPIRILYICTLRSIIRGTCKELRIACYIQKDGTIEKEFICKPDEIGICLKSIHHLEGKIFDLVILDESEELGMWASWEANNHPLLLKFMANAKISICQDADAGDLTYSLIDRASRYRETELALLQNSASWIAQQHHKLILVQKEIQIWDEICTEVANGGFCFVHVDFADKIGKENLKAIETAFNNYFGEATAKSFCDKSPRDELIRLEQEKNTYIPELYQQGIRIILVSPKIQSGWRYTAEPLFTATYGVYRHNFIPAPMIVQRTQRGTHTSNHYVYVTPTRTWTDIDALTNDLNTYTEEKATFSKIGPRNEGHELAVEATAKKQKMLDNVKLHLAIYWDSFGGALQFMEALEVDAEVHKHFNKLVSDAKKQLREEDAIAILEDEHKLEQFRLMFNAGMDFLDPIEIGELKTPGELLPLIDLFDMESMHHATAREMLELLQMDTDVISRDEFIDSILSADKGSSVGRYQLKLLIDAIDQIVPTEIDGGLLGFLKQPNKIMVIETEALSEVDGILKRYRDVFRARLGKEFSRTTRADTALKTIFKKIFLCDVLHDKTNSDNKPRAKNALIQHYKDRGYLQKKNYKVGDAIKLCHTVLKERIAVSPDELSEIELKYLETNRALITIKNKNVYVTKRTWLLHNIREDYRARKAG